MYLSVITPMMTSNTMRAMDNEQDMHKNVVAMFGTRREDVNALYRKQQCREMPFFKVLVQSDVKPVSTKDMMVGNVVCIDEWNATLTNGTRVKFTVTARPMKGNKGKHTPLKTHEECMEWFERQGNEHGFRTVVVSGRPVNGTNFRHDKNSQRINLGGYTYSGILEITDIEKFNDVYSKGLGRGKAYGYGMLMLGSKVC